MRRRFLHFLNPRNEHDRAVHPALHGAPQHPELDCVSAHVTTDHNALLWTPYLVRHSRVTSAVGFCLCVKLSPSSVLEIVNKYLLFFPLFKHSSHTLSVRIEMFYS
jgi:hypothetical protein